MTMTQTITRPSAPPGATRASLEVARRALRKYIRTPGLWAMGIVQSVLFLFPGGGISGAGAEDRVQGFTDRLLPLPLPRYSIVLGRTLADSTTNAWSILSTAAFGFLFGFRLGGTLLDRLAAPR